ncbi:Riboflavin transporter MCH5-like protein 1 [Colletotrichum chlorophyti]|uniref:Riboflavin transporter MCH5-like protein 1 n=1 Tax=Colletotrichum chlorophyti TaxID=708187 RepID=A0A1Q8RQT3_9PEZI|nr:Riboflavin transporter MCH5-like protein 1 [Colletotrichum chlorophyti]
MASPYSSPRDSSHELDGEIVTQRLPRSEAQPETQAGEQSTPPEREITSSNSLTNDAEKVTPAFGVAPDGGLRAWMVASGAATIFFCTLGLSNTFGLFVEYYMTHQLQGQTASNISWIGSVQSFLQFFSGMLGGPLFDRYGVWIIYPSAVLYVFSLMMLSLCSRYWHFMLVQGILMGIVQGFLQIPAFAAVAQYFDKKRAAALGLAVAGSSIGGIAMPFILSKMLNNSSITFAWSVRIIGFIVLFFMAFACVAVKPRIPPRKTRLFLVDPWKQARFVMFIAALLIIFVGMFTPAFYLPTYATTQGMGSALAGYLIAIVNATSTFGRIVPGILADKYGNLNIFAIGGISTGIIVFCMTLATTNAGLIVYAAFFGLGSGTIMSGAAASLSRCADDPSEVGTYMGMGMAVAGVGALVGPPINGAIAQATGGYFAVCMFSGTITVAGGIFVFSIKATDKNGLWGRA